MATDPLPVSGDSLNQRLAEKASIHFSTEACREVLLGQRDHPSAEDVHGAKQSKPEIYGDRLTPTRAGEMRRRAAGNR